MRWDVRISGSMAVPPHSKSGTICTSKASKLRTTLVLAFDFFLYKWGDTKKITQKKTCPLVTSDGSVVEVPKAREEKHDKRTVVDVLSEV